MKLGFPNVTPLYDPNDIDPMGRLRKPGPNVVSINGSGAQALPEPLCTVTWRDPTFEEQAEFNVAYFAAVSKKDDGAGGAGKVLFEFGLKLVTQVEGLETPPGVGPLDALKRWGYHHVVPLAQLAYLRGKVGVDLGKSASSPAPSTEASSAGSSEAPAQS